MVNLVDVMDEMDVVDAMDTQFFGMIYPLLKIRFKRGLYGSQDRQSE